MLKNCLKHKKHKFYKIRKKTIQKEKNNDIILTRKIEMDT